MVFLLRAIGNGLLLKLLLWRHMATLSQACSSISFWHLENTMSNDMNEYSFLLERRQWCVNRKVIDLMPMAVA
jgi:hypothetical protein